MMGKPLVAVFANEDADVFGFRKELLKALTSRGYELLISCPYGEKIELLKKEITFAYDNPPIDRRGTNAISDFRLIIHYAKIVAKYQPKVALMFTIKPNVYAGMVCALSGISYFGSITGLGTSIQNGGLLSYISLFLYKIGLCRAKTVFFQNKDNLRLMVERKVLAESRCKLVPGSGVNTDYFDYQPYPPKKKETIFVVVGRIMKDKGTDEILSAAKAVKEKYPDVVFKLIGAFDGNYEEIIADAEKYGLIEYLGKKSDVRPYYRECNAIIHASYHEGMSNVLLEAASTGRPVIATCIPGCREIFEDDITGIGFEAKNSDSLIAAIARFMNIPYEKKVEMGIRGRNKVKKEFERKIVVDAYISEIEKYTH